jgi:FHS family glucose/mannose:H+ symporter-like MFS transporter
VLASLVRENQADNQILTATNHGVGELEGSGRSATPRHPAANLVIHAAFVATGIVTVVLGPILPILITRWSLSDERAGLFFAMQFCGQLAGSLSTGLLIPLRRCGYRLTFAIGFALVAIGVAALAVGDARMGLAGTGIYGYGLGLALTGGNLWVAEIFPERRATAVSILNVVWTLGAIACGPLVMLAERAHMLANFLLGVAIFMALCALFIAAWHIEPDETLAAEPEASGMAKPRNLFSPAAIALGALFFLYVGTEEAVGGWVAAYVNRVEAMSAMMSALTPAFFWGGLMTGRALAPIALRAVAERILVAAGLIAAILATGTLLYASTYRSAIICAAIAGLGLACIYPILVGWLVRIFGAHARRFGSIVFATGSLGGATIPWLVGAVSTHTGALRFGLAVPIGACVAMSLVNGFFPWRRNS